MEDYLAWLSEVSLIDDRLPQARKGSRPFTSSGALYRGRGLS